MKVIKKTKVEREVEMLVDEICNVCGESLMRCGGFYGLNLEYAGGFESDPLSDKRYTAEICERCLSDWFKTFKIPVEEHDYGAV